MALVAKCEKIEDGNYKGYKLVIDNADIDTVTGTGEKVNLSDELMTSGRVKVGDLIGNNGHMAIIAGWDDSYYYIAESLDTTKGVSCTFQ